MFIDNNHPVVGSDGNPLKNVASVEFQEEQAGYLAGYAVVKEGYTKLGFSGGGGGGLDRLFFAFGHCYIDTVIIGFYVFIDRLLVCFWYWHIFLLPGGDLIFHSLSLSIAILYLICLLM